MRTFIYNSIAKVAGVCLPKKVARVFEIKAKECRLIMAAIDPNAHELSRRNAVRGLVEYLQSDEFKMQVRRHRQVSVGGFIFFESDLFGPEIRLMSRGNPMLDASPKFYHLTRQQAEAIYNAICEKAY